MAAVGPERRISCGFALAVLLSAATSVLQAQTPDLTRASRWLDAARSAMDSTTTDSLRRPIALGYARLRRGPDALEIDPGSEVVSALACAYLTRGDTAAAEIALLRVPEVETRGWLQARLVDIRALPWPNVRPNASTVAATLAGADAIELPEARVNAELRLASALLAIQDTGGAQARLAEAWTAYGRETDTLRRVEDGLSLAWIEATMGDPERSLSLVHGLSRGVARVGALTGVAGILRARGFDPASWLREAESLAVAERRPAMRRHALDDVIAAYDSVADSATIHRLRKLRPVPRPPAATNLDRARARIAAADTAAALRLAATYPDPRHLGHRAAALKRFGWDLLEGPGVWSWRDQAYRLGISEARRIQNAGMRAMLLYDLAYILATLGDYTTPERESRLREAEVVADYLPPESRIHLLQAVAEEWARQSDSEFHRLLGLMPTRADSSRLINRVVWQMDNAAAGMRAVDSVRRSARDQLTEMLATAALARFGRRRGMPELDVPGLLARLTLPEDTALLPGLLRAKVAGDTLRLEQWAREQPTSLARAIAFQALATDAMLDGRIWSGWPGCFDD